jgi:hypothetical protein
MTSLSAFATLAVSVLSSCSTQPESSNPESLPGARSGDVLLLDGPGSDSGSGSSDGCAGQDSPSQPLPGRGAIIVDDDGILSQYPTPICSPRLPHRHVMVFGNADHYLLIRRSRPESIQAFPTPIAFPMTPDNYCAPCNQATPGDRNDACNTCNGHSIVACWRPSSSPEGHPADITFWQAQAKYDVWRCPSDSSLGPQAPTPGTLHVGTDNT